ncbi:glycosyltransferase family 4 protein [Aquabacter spiritensis]|uniref:Glycosyltransferase involved in cell wall biosynthesis n=1 Tax=Aquabacter spiritensis TaxID=933073 RepID=A0A4R3LTV8_9HYPH|nr:glycosyltransferase family 4 protein [Aquabacter spiritensis]TCT03973.1 glycosyltransferase involved in cell wall biosynthesis [Aquabacter spiritensis]
MSPAPRPVDVPSPAYRVAFVNTHPIQYFAPLYAYLGAKHRISVTALYLSDVSLRGARDAGFGQPVAWDVDLLAGYEARFMGEAARRREVGGFFSMVGPELWPAIRRGAFDAVIIHGHNLAAHHVALAAAKTSGTAVFARGDTHLGLHRPRWRSQARRAVLCAWYRAFDGVLAVGTANALYYRAMGVPPERIHIMPFAVDNARFMAGARLAPEERADLRRRLGLKPDLPVVLFAAKFEPRKRPEDLVRAMAGLQREGIAGQVLLVGSGETEPDLRALVAQSGIADVVFHGFANQSALPAIYGVSDIFVLPAENEPWGLAVNEAMCAGLAIVASDEVGCVPDLVETGVTGATFRARDLAGLAAALRPLLADADHRRRCGAHSLARIARWSYRESADGLMRALAAVDRHTGGRG